MVMPFSELPEAVILHIAELLSIEDVDKLSKTCQRFKGILPKYSFIKGYDINEIGQSRGDWEPTQYFEGPFMEAKVHKLTVSMRWKDQVCCFAHRAM